MKRFIGKIVNGITVKSRFLILAIVMSMFTVAAITIGCVFGDAVTSLIVGITTTISSVGAFACMLVVALEDRNENK